MLYNIKTTYTLHGACACNPETVLWSRAGWRRACEPVSVGSKARTPAKLHPEATSTVSLYTAQHPPLLILPSSSPKQQDISNINCQPVHSPASHAAAQGRGWRRRARQCTVGTCGTNGTRKTHQPERRRATAVTGQGVVARGLSLPASPTTAWFWKGKFFRRHLSFHQETLADCYLHCSPFLSRCPCATSRGSLQTCAQGYRQISCACVRACVCACKCACMHACLLVFSFTCREQGQEYNSNRARARAREREREREHTRTHACIHGTDTLSGETDTTVHRPLRAI